MKNFYSNDYQFIMNNHVVLKTYGNKIISYILNISEKEVEKILNNESNLTKTQTQILKEYIIFCLNTKSQGLNGNEPDFFFISNLSNFKNNNGIHYFTIWNRISGGIPLNLNVKDPLLNLATIAFEKIYPILLFTSDGFLKTFENLKLLAATYKIKEIKTFENFLKQDIDLSKLYNYNKNNKSICIYYSSLKSETLPSNISLLILKKVYELIVIDPKLKINNYPDIMDQFLKTLKLIITGNSIKSKMFLFFEGIGLNKLEKINTKYGIIYPYSKRYKKLFPKCSRINLKDNSYQNLGFILETTFSYKAILNKSRSKNLIERTLTQKLITEIKENISLAFLLSLYPEKKICPKLKSIYFFDPLDMNYCIDSFKINTSKYYILKNNDINKIQKWIKKIQNTNNSKITICIKTLLSALNEKNDITSQFIELISALENLFNSRKYNKISYHLKECCSKVIKKDKKALIKKLYEQRSRKSHGDKLLDFTNSKIYKDETLDILLDVLKNLYLYHPHLLSKSQDQRVQEIMNYPQNKYLK